MKFLFCILSASALLLPPVVTATDTSSSSSELLRGGGTISGDDEHATGRTPPAAAAAGLNIVWETSEQQGPQQQVGSVKKKQRHLEGNRIVNGDRTEPWDYPYYVYMAGCGGALIAPGVVLTAGHCGDFNNKQVIIGQIERGSLEPSAQVRFCDTSIIDPNYSSDTMDNDFALCRLDVAAEIATDRVVLTMNENNAVPADGEELRVCGMGALSSDGSQSNFLMDVAVDTISQEQCNAESWYGGRITDNMLCAGFAKGEKDSCQGDSGGPMVQRKDLGDGKYEDIHVGVVSWGWGCADPKNPGVYARTSFGATWIKSVVCDTWKLPAEFCPPGNSPPEPESCNTNNELIIDVTTDAYADETSIMLRPTNGGPVLLERIYEVNTYANQHKVCLQSDTCYDFIIFDKVGDGLCDGSQCGSYSLTLDGVKKMNGNPNFYFSFSYRICSGDGVPSPQQAPSPIAAPMPTPTDNQQPTTGVPDDAPYDAPFPFAPYEDPHYYDGPIEGPVNYPTLDFLDPETFVPILEISIPVSSKGVCPEEGMSKFQVDIATDLYPNEMYWNLVNGDGDILAGSDRQYLDGESQHFEPSMTEYYCLALGTYIFEMFDAANDGYCCLHGAGHMKGLLNGVQIFEGGAFESEDFREFIVGELPEVGPTEIPTNFPTTNEPSDVPSPSPTKSPTPRPTNPPAECTELQDTYGVFLKQSTGNNCIWMSPDEDGGATNECPKMCKICANDNDAPPPPPQSCQDEAGSHKFFTKLNRLKNKKCSWIGKNTEKRCKFFHEDGRTASDVCPDTCDTCQGSNGPDVKNCTDEPGVFTVYLKAGNQNPKVKTCDWTLGIVSRCNKYLEEDTTKQVFTKCPISCNELSNC